MENYEELRQRRLEVKARMNELSLTESTLGRVEEHLENIDSRSQQTLEHSLNFYAGMYKSCNGFTLKENITERELQDRVVEATVIKILKKEIRARQKKAEEARFSRRLHR